MTEDSTFRFPSEKQMLFPLLSALRENGPMRPKDAAEAVAEKLCVPNEARHVTVNYDDGRGPVNLFERSVRWTRQNGVRAGLIGKGKVGIWELSEEGHKGLTMAKPGVMVRVARDEFGEIYWAEAETAMCYLDKSSINAIISSPPFPLRQQRAYGGWPADRWMEIALAHIAKMKPLLADGGSLVLNLADVYYSGIPSLDTYQEELVVEMRRSGWHLAGKYFQINPSKPKTTPWVTKSRERVANGVETYFWWTPTPHCQANNRNVLEPYSERYLRTLAGGGEIRMTRSGSRQTCPGRRHKVDNGGKIPYNYFVSAPEGPRSPYSRYCKDHGLPRHPAIMTHDVAEFLVKLLTVEGQVLYEPFAGSLKLPAVCKQLRRRYLASEKCLEYICGGLSRLGPDIEDLTDIFERQRALVMA